MVTANTAAVNTTCEHVTRCGPGLEFEDHDHGGVPALLWLAPSDCYHEKPDRILAEHPFCNGLESYNIDFLDQLRLDVRFERKRGLVREGGEGQSLPTNWGR